MSRKTRSGILIAVLALVALSLQAVSAQAATRSYTAVEKRGVFTFKVAGLRGKVKAARVSSGRARRVVAARTVERAARRGTLRTRGPRVAFAARAARRRRATLTVTTTTSSTTAPTTTAPTSGSTGTSETTLPEACRTTETVVFSATNLPGGCWRPYSDASPFNQVLPAGAKISSRSDAIVRRITGFGSVQNLTAGQAGTADDFGHPTFYNKVTDPEFTVHCVEDWGTCPVEGMKVRIPDQAKAAAGDDGHMTVVDQASGFEYDFWQVRNKPAGGGRIDISWGGRIRIDGDGLGADATAAKFGNLAGIIRAQEMERGEINHALFMVIKCDSGSYVYPAKKTGAKCADGTDAPPMGTRLKLDMTDAEINSLSVPAWKKTIFRAMANYGLIFGDTGSGSWAIQAESGSTYTSFGKEDALKTYGEKVGVPTYEGKPVFNIKDGVDWSSRLKVVDPCVSQRTCV